MRRSGLCLAPFLIFTLSLHARDTESAAPAAVPFPLLPLVQASRRGELPWRPDWPLSIPPDAFQVPGAAAIVLSTGDSEYALRRDSLGRLAAFPWPFAGALLNIAFTDGTEWPGGFRVTDTATGLDAGPGAAVQLDPVLESNILARDAGAGTDSPLWTAVFLDFSEDDPSLPRLCRLSAGDEGVWYFVVIEYRGRYSLETWYASSGGDAETGAVREAGTTGEAGAAALGIFECTWSGDFSRDPGAARLLLQTWTAFQAPASRTDTGGGATDNAAAAPPPAPPARFACFYDSFGNLSGITADGLEYAARFREGRPLYWNRPVSARDLPPLPGSGGTGGDGGGVSAPVPGIFRFQWDGRGLAVRFTGLAGAAPADNGTAGAFSLDSRHEYGLDGAGNWTERRETVLFRSGRFLVPQGERHIRRFIAYRAAD